MTAERKSFLQDLGKSALPERVGLGTVIWFLLTAVGGYGVGTGNIGTEEKGNAEVMAELRSIKEVQREAVYAISKLNDLYTEMRLKIDKHDRELAKSKAKDE